MEKLSNAEIAHLYFEGTAEQTWSALGIVMIRGLSEQDLLDYYLDKVGRD